MVEPPRNDSTSEQAAERTQFQLERMILFSDAVFAIAITLLIIEIKVPEPKPPFTEASLLQSMVTLIPKVIGFLLSFFLIGLYWTVHHRMFGYLTNYTRKLIWMNLVFLLAIVMMPFSTAFFSEYSTPETIHLLTPLISYVANIWFIGLMNFKLWGYIGKPASKISEGIPGGHFLALARTRSLVVPIIFSCMIPVALFAPSQARYIPMAIPFVMKVVNGLFEINTNRLKT